MKRIGPWANSRTTLAQARAARAAAARARQYNNIPRGVIYRQPQRITTKRFVNRTPGGNVVGDNHYYDVDLYNTPIVSVATTWGLAINDPGTRNCLFCPIQGDDISNRQGRKCFVKKIRINGSVAIPGQPGLDPFTNIRVLVVQDMQTNGTQMTGNLLLNSGSATDGIHMFQSTQNFGRFKILKDKTYNMANRSIAGVTGSLNEGYMVREFKWVIKPMCWVNFNATNGQTVADIIDNSFHIMVGATDVSSTPVISYKCRVIFTP